MGHMDLSQICKAMGANNIQTILPLLDVMVEERMLIRMDAKPPIQYRLNMERYEEFTNALGGKRVRPILIEQQAPIHKPSNHDADNRPTGIRLAELILMARGSNQGILPNVHTNPSYICETCGNGADGRALEHPHNETCFICGQDDWIDADCWHAGIRGEQYLKIMTRLGK